MTDEKKIELLKNKLGYLTELAVKKNPQLDTAFLAFFNSLKDNDAFFEALVADQEQLLNNRKAALQSQLQQIETAKTEVIALKAQLNAEK